MSQSYVLKHEQCPVCAKLGKDNSQDNRAVYSDGHTYCYSCGDTTFPNTITKFKKENHTPNLQPTKPIYLPYDSDIIYPTKALDWIHQYELTKIDLYNNNVLWSESTQRLIFPIYGGGNLIAWQGRYFGVDSALTKPPKWYGKGNLKDTFNILGKGSTIILTEDIISAIKVSKCGVLTMPLYGCVVGRERFKRLKELIEPETLVRIWLDPDKRVEAIKEAKLGRCMNINTTTIFSERDPKEQSFDEIINILKGV